MNFLSMYINALTLPTKYRIHMTDCRNSYTRCRKKLLQQQQQQKVQVQLTLSHSDDKFFAINVYQCTYPHTTYV